MKKRFSPKIDNKPMKPRGNVGGNVIIGESTPIRLGLILGFISVLSVSIWWAASITAKLDSIIAFQSTTSTIITKLEAQDMSHEKTLDDVRMRLTIVELGLKDLQNKNALIAP